MPAVSPIIADPVSHGPTFTQTYAHARPGGAMHDGVPPEVASRLVELEAMADLAARSYGSEVNNLIDTRNAAMADLEAYKRSCRDAHRESDGREVARLQARIDRATRTLTLANKEIKRFPNTLPSLAQEAAKLVGAMTRQGKTIEWHGDVKVPKDATVESLRFAIDELLAQRDRLDTALPPIDDARNQLRHELDKLAGHGIDIDLEVNHSDLSGRARPPRVRLALPKERVAHVKSDVPGEFPIVTSAVGIVCVLFRDQVEAIIEARLRELYANGPLALSADERRSELARIDDEILELSRVEAQLGWDAIANGERAAFRSDLDPRAVLGIR